MLLLCWKSLKFGLLDLSTSGSERPWIFLAVDRLSEYRIELITRELFCVKFILGVELCVTDYPSNIGTIT